MCFIGRTDIFLILMSLKIRFSTSTEKKITISEINVKTAFEGQTLHMYSFVLLLFNKPSNITSK